MKYFELHIGDYQSKTAHLSLAEHGAYLLMIMHFCSSERPIPGDRRVLYRLLRAESAAERKAIDAVASEFWDERDGKLINKRAEIVLAEYLEWVGKQKANGKRGGRPSLNGGEPNGNPSLSHGQPNGGDSHLHLPSSPPILNPTPLPPSPSGEGGDVRETRTRKDRKSEAATAWTRLTNSDGEIGREDPRVQRGITAAGGWSRISARQTGLDAARVQNAFIAGFLEVSP